MIHAKGYSSSPMVILLPFLLSAVVLTSSAFRSETRRRAVRAARVTTWKATSKLGSKDLQVWGDAFLERVVRPETEANSAIKWKGASVGSGTPMEEHR